jgi:Tol biopolymer transport system component
MPLEGGETKQLTDYHSTEPNVSPDGKYIACYFTDEKNIYRIGVVPFEGGAPIKTLNLPTYVYIDMSPKWMPDGLGITYVDRQNLWLLPIDGSPAKQLTDYKQGRIYRREWTRDGKQVAIVRGESTNDVVMITDFK